MTEKELIRRTEQKLRLYQIMKINYNNLEDDIKKLETKKEGGSVSFITVTGARSLNTDNFNLIKINDTINKKRGLQDRLGDEMRTIERALKQIKGEQYFYIIDEYYLKDKSIQEIIEKNYISNTTFFNNRNRMLKKIGMLLFPDVFVKLSLNFN